MITIKHSKFEFLLWKYSKFVITAKCAMKKMSESRNNVGTLKYYQKEVFVGRHMKVVTTSKLNAISHSHMNAAPKYLTLIYQSIILHLL